MLHYHVLATLTDGSTTRGALCESRERAEAIVDTLALTAQILERRWLPATVEECRDLICEAEHVTHMASFRHEARRIARLTDAERESYWQTRNVPEIPDGPYLSLD